MSFVASFTLCLTLLFALATQVRLGPYPYPDPDGVPHVVSFQASVAAMLGEWSPFANPNQSIDMSISASMVRRFFSIILNRNAFSEFELCMNRITSAE